MVWVDLPMNQAKSNIVDQDQNVQAGNIKKITDFTSSASYNKALDMEYFLRNFAAVGDCNDFPSAFTSRPDIHTDLDQNAGKFQSTAQHVQDLLTEVTPPSPEFNLPAVFNAWLRGLVSSYPASCSSLMLTTYSNYQAQMNQISQKLGTAVPNCFSLYHAGGPVPSSFTWQNLIPPAPTIPDCNLPGTEGQVILYTNALGIPVVASGSFFILGSGNSNFHALGTTRSLSSPHYVAEDLTYVGTGCAGVYSIGLGLPTAGPNFVDAHIAVDCNGQQGKVATPFNFVVNDQQLLCILLNFNDGTNGYYTVCGPGPTNDAAAWCAIELLPLLLPTYPHLSDTVPSFAFFPV
ncbi:hypothetical protein FB45DRAFT_1138282 [Roridomyces roridus]|uniref:Uncharacterized protein n=1 Tax=Roridomyces roridus TaxID=1738132 RepID=A0AAD7C1G9_9AGAR|nr:hypothetical protein FB45DRAFT_1138282 [Roridomyces roridus]